MDSGLSQWWCLEHPVNSTSAGIRCREFETIDSQLDEQKSPAVPYLSLASSLGRCLSLSHQHPAPELNDSQITQRNGMPELSVSSTFGAVGDRDRTITQSGVIDTSMPASLKVVWRRPWALTHTLCLLDLHESHLNYVVPRSRRCAGRA